MSGRSNHSPAARDYKAPAGIAASPGSANPSPFRLSGRITAHLVTWVAAVSVALLFSFASRDAVGTQTPGLQHAQGVELALPLPRSVTRTQSMVEASVTDGEQDRVSTELRVRRGDSLAALFDRNGLSRQDLAAMMRLAEARDHLRVLQPGDRIHVVAEDDRVLALSRRLDEGRSLSVVRGTDGFDVRMDEDRIERRLRFATGVIGSSLYKAGLDAGMSESLIMDLAGLFAWDVDFALDIRRGDSFSLVYEEIWRDGERIRDGAIVAAEFVNRGETFRAIRYTDPTGETDYFTPEGRNIRKAFLRAPVDFRRISSNFNPNRLHPVLKTRRPHRGVDYAADRGTPVWAAGEGTVIFRGVKGGYGNCVIVQHGDNITTLYAHLSSFKRGQRVGSRVKQKDVIGFVGATGLVTAAHLHYEFRKDGVHRNPRTVDLPKAEPIAEAYREDFLAQAAPRLAQLHRARLATAEPVGTTGALASAAD